MIKVKLMEKIKFKAGTSSLFFQVRRHSYIVHRNNFCTTNVKNSLTIKLETFRKKITLARAFVTHLSMKHYYIIINILKPFLCVTILISLRK